MLRISQTARSTWLCAGILLLLLAAPRVALGQGCMPLRFTSPGLAGVLAPYLVQNDWQFEIALRRVTTDKFFVGSQENESAAPGGLPPLDLSLNSLDLSITYATTERLSFTFTMPLSHATAYGGYPDSLHHTVSSTGVGDLNLMANFWLVAPGRQPKGNLLFGLGVKAPTGNNHIMGTFHYGNGVDSLKPVTQTIQLGDGGWSIPLQVQGFQQIFPKGSAYFSAFYSISLRQHTDVVSPESQGYDWAVPDTYSARLGVAYGLITEQGLSVSLGGRIDGTTLGDLVGGRTDYFRRAGYTVYVDPGVTWQNGANLLTLNVPVRVYDDYMNMTIANGTKVRVGKGGVADYAVYLSYSRIL
jgi:hypothetical protein